MKLGTAINFLMRRVKNLRRENESHQPHPSPQKKFPCGARAAIQRQREPWKLLTRPCAFRRINHCAWSWTRLSILANGIVAELDSQFFPRGEIQEGNFENTGRKSSACGCDRRRCDGLRHCAMAQLPWRHSHPA